MLKVLLKPLRHIFVSFLIQFLQLNFYFVRTIFLFVYSILNRFLSHGEYGLLVVSDAWQISFQVIIRKALWYVISLCLLFYISYSVISKLLPLESLSYIQQNTTKCLKCLSLTLSINNTLVFKNYFVFYGSSLFIYFLIQSFLVCEIIPD